MLSVYESSPDKFDFSKSWGWRSSTLMLDEVFLQQRQEEAEISLDAGDAVASAGTVGEGEGVVSGAEPNAKEVRERDKKKREGILRFMVVIGNL